MHSAELTLPSLSSFVYTSMDAVNMVVSTRLVESLAKTPKIENLPLS